MSNKVFVTKNLARSYVRNEFYLSLGSSQEAEYAVYNYLV